MMKFSWKVYSWFMCLGTAVPVMWEASEPLTLKDLSKIYLKGNQKMNFDNLYR